MRFARRPKICPDCVSKRLIHLEEATKQPGTVWSVFLPKTEVVGLRGFEPPTSRTPSVRATKLRYSPTKISKIISLFFSCTENFSFLKITVL